MASYIMGSMDGHHACLLYGDSLSQAGLPPSYLQQSADVLHIALDRFGIDDARKLAGMASQTPLQAQSRVFVIAVKDIATEAQNALLKLFEEPPKRARFYLVVPRGTQLLPTLRSRLHEPAKEEEGTEELGAYAAFRTASYKDRLALIAELTKNKNVQAQEEILRGCERDAARQTDLLRPIVFARAYSKSRGASLKMLLEELALTLRA